MRTATFTYENRTYTVEQSISGDYCRLLYGDHLIIDDSACEDFYGTPEELVDVFKSYLEGLLYDQEAWWLEDEEEENDDED